MIIYLYPQTNISFISHIIAALRKALSDSLRKFLRKAIFGKIINRDKFYVMDRISILPETAIHQI